MNRNSQAKPARIEAKRSFSKIWFLPIIAAIIGIGMVYNDWQNRGKEIEISFETAEGLVANKTAVKYRSVDVGLVESIELNDDKSSVVLKVEIDKAMVSLLKEDTEFWVVRPRVGAQGVSGIGTLLSGAYIEIAPGETGLPLKRYVGLELPPVTDPSADGLHLELSSSGGKSISVGNPVVYRGFTVGQVESFDLDAETRTARYSIFINAPYHALVSTNTYFWNAGGISITADAKGVEVDMASIDSLLSGGVEFDVPADLDFGKQVTEPRAFKLYESKLAVEGRKEYQYFEYAILVDDSVGGLFVDAPVEYRGIRVGSVAAPYLKFDTERDLRNGVMEDPRIPIIIRIEPGRIYEDPDVAIDEFRFVIESGILNGLSATIESANLLTGTMKVALDFIGDAQSEIEHFGSYPVIPSKRGGIGSITEKIESILDKIEGLPLDKTVTQANSAIGSADESLATLTQSLQELQTTLKGLQPGSDVYQSFNKSLLEFQNTLDSVKPVLKQLSNKPNSLIFGGAGAEDEEPKARGQ